MDDLRTGLLMAAIITYGIAAGVHQVYAFVIMPALAKTDDRTFVSAYQEIDRTIVGPFLSVFFIGPVVLSGLATALHLGSDQHSALPLVAGSFVLGLGIMVVTVVIHVPLNNAIKAAGPPDRIDVAAERKSFSEARWLKWHWLRVLFSMSGLVCLAFVLV